MRQIIARRFPGIIAGAVVVFAAALTLQAQQASTPPEVDADGTIHVPSFLLPESSLLDDGTRAALKRIREQKEDLFEEKKCPPESSDRAAMVEVRKCQAEAFYKTSYYKRLRDRYHVAMTPQEIGGVHAEVFTPEEGIPAENKNRVLINVHGGHFKIGSRTISHLESIPIASDGKFKVVSVDYRMAPEYAFPAASEDVGAVYRELLKTYKPQNIGVYGCSAGGLLTAESVAWFQKQGLPLPGAVAMTGGAASYYQDGDSALIASARDGFPLEPPREHPYFKVTDAHNPLAFPIYSPETMAKFPPSLLIATTRDLALSSVVHTHSQLVKLGVDAELHVWEGLAHCFMFGHDVKQADDAHDVIVRFFDHHLGK